MANSPGGFIWYELMTPDPTAAAKFYGAVVGWKIAAHADPQAGGGLDYRGIVRSDGGSAGGVLKLTTTMQQHGARTAWFGYLHVRNVDAATKAIEADGGRTWMPKKTLPVGDIAMVSDPMDSPFYVMSPVPPPGKPDATSDVFDTQAVEHVQWNELATPDLARAKAFYAKHFGFEFKDSVPMGGTFGNYCFISLAGVTIGAILQRPAQSRLDGWLYYFGVRSVAAAKRAIEAGGGKLTNEPHEITGGDWILTATDPQGAAFGVVGPRGN